MVKKKHTEELYKQHLKAKWSKLWKISVERETITTRRPEHLFSKQVHFNNNNNNKTTRTPTIIRGVYYYCQPLRLITYFHIVDANTDKPDDLHCTALTNEILGF